MTEPQHTPTPEEQAAAQDVGQAVVQAAADAPDAATARTDAAAAARKAADKANLEITEEQIEAIANGVVSAMEARGAFEPPPEPVAPPPTVPAEPAAAAPADPNAPGAPPAPAPDAGPRKRTFAQRFLGE